MNSLNNFKRACKRIFLTILLIFSIHLSYGQTGCLLDGDNKIVTGTNWARHPRTYCGGYTYSFFSPIAAIPACYNSYGEKCAVGNRCGTVIYGYTCPPPAPLVQTPIDSNGWMLVIFTSIMAVFFLRKYSFN